jgi:glycosyltransferase involved in cell wall biosynthesis
MMRQPEPTPLAARRPTPTVSSRTGTTASPVSDTVAGVSSPRCLVIVPVFNERGSVSKVVRRLRQSLPDFDVLVIDDGSTDDTLRQIPAGVTVVSLPFNLGIGGAMQTGYKYAALHGYDVAVQVDGDGQHRPSEVRRLVDCVINGGVDLAVGSRFLSPTKYRQTLVRRVGAYMLGLLIRMLTGLWMTDCTSGFRAANRRVIRAFAHWYPEDYPEPEVILLLHRTGYAIGEFSVRMRHRRNGQSSIGLLEGLFYVLKVTTCLLLDMVRAPWPHEKFGIPAEARSEAEAEADVAATSPISNAHDAQEPDPAHPWREPVHTGRPASPPI